MDSIYRVIHDVLLGPSRRQDHGSIWTPDSHPDWIVYAHLRPDDVVNLEQVLPDLLVTIRLQRDGLQLFVLPVRDSGNIVVLATPCACHWHYGGWI